MLLAHCTYCRCHGATGDLSVGDAGGPGSDTTAAAAACGHAAAAKPPGSLPLSASPHLVAAGLHASPGGLTPSSDAGADVTDAAAAEAPSKDTAFKSKQLLLWFGVRRIIRRLLAHNCAM